MNSPLLESCVESWAQCLQAVAGGADRIELCADLSVGGLTPGRALIRKACTSLPVPVRVMIRPHAQGFVYSSDDIKQMLTDIAFCKSVGAEGVVFGPLRENNTIHVEQTQTLAWAAQPLQVVFHKAIDCCPDILEALAILKGIPAVTAVLTSGGAATAVDGLPTLQQMLVSAGHLEMVVAGKVRPDNLSLLKARLAGASFHGRAIVPVK